MGWPEHMDPSLQAYIEERQLKALQTYETDHDLLVEHVRQEDSFKSGGYGTRQISELLQNAVDALGATGGSGTVELRLADGALYCANEGAAFTQDGVRAVTYAFLSPKREDQIGRFGLGFKSVLGVTEHPQIYSRSVGFEFNAPGTAELFSGIPTAGGRVPLLRVPQLADPLTAAAEDPNLAEMMQWATTIVKLPLTREGSRLRDELENFLPETLLFFKPVDKLRITWQRAVGAAAESREFLRDGDVDDGEVTITPPEGDPQRWLYAERTYEPSEEVASTLPDTSRRSSMTVSYAVRPDNGTRTGRLWAWFPLRDETTAGGVFNAPWQVNDDRTSLVSGSQLNRAMLGVAADLFLDVVSRASTAGDPAAHLDLFPARGKETRSNADRFLTDEIPTRAARRTMIPDTTGALRVPSFFERVPDLQKTPITASAAREWQDHVARETMPHWQCFTTATRRARLRTLLGGSDEQRSARETTVAAWLEELARSGDVGIVAALQVAAELRAGNADTRAAVGGAPIVPMEGGGWARVDATSSVLVPVDGASAPEGVKVVRASFAREKGVAHLLRSLGFRAVSADETATALAHAASHSWTERDWKRFWNVVSAATPAVGKLAVETVRQRHIDVFVPTTAGRWERAGRVVADGAIVRSAEGRHLDASIIPNRTLAIAAGAVTGPVDDYAVEFDALWPMYSSAMESTARKMLRDKGVTGARVVIPSGTGVGPLDILDEDLTESDRIDWTRRVLVLMRRREDMVRVSVGARHADVPILSFAWWSVWHFGRVLSTRGAVDVPEAVGAKLQRFGPYLPVVPAEVGLSIGAPNELAGVPPQLLSSFLERDGYGVETPSVFAELIRECAARTDLALPARIPALSRGMVMLSPRGEVAVTAQPVETVALDEAGVPYIPTDGDYGKLVEGWALIHAADALQQSLEVVGLEPAVPILDLYPSLQQSVGVGLRKQRIARATSLKRVLQSANGISKRSLRSAKHDGVIVVDAVFDSETTLLEASKALDLGLTLDDARRVLAADEDLHRSELIQQAQTARNDEKRLLILVGADVLRRTLPNGLLPAVESRMGVLEDREVAELFLQVYAHDAVREIRHELARAGIPVPTTWDGSPAAQRDVKRLGFDTAYAGRREARPSHVTQVQGKLVLNPLHDYQQILAAKITELATADDPSKKRGLLYLPTGAGKTRVTVEAIVDLMKTGQVSSPLLWIAQSEELCEQAIEAFSDVWRWKGDERVLDISRFWSSHELDESDEDLQVVVAIDATLSSRLEEPQYSWLAKAGMVVIDEAHTALAASYTTILRALGLTAARTDRPLLGLTATPFRGRNEEVNRRFVQRFGERRLESLDPDDPIGQLRDMHVLSEVDYDLLDGIALGVGDQDAEFLKMKEVTPGMLGFIGQDIKRTQSVVDHIHDLLQEHPDWPVLVFAASVASAHTTAALLRVADVRADSVDGGMRKQQRRAVIQRFKSGEAQVLVNCDLLTQGFDAPMVRALYIARPTFSPNRYLQMVGRGLRGPKNGGTDRCLIVNVEDTFDQFGEKLAYNEFDYLWRK
ncbi:DEAD/DEAH box helicase [Microbacterium terrisoli]|uniref:DEAD/DEAH box helicase n=1 Tax=Microbacterium terrisoli TaxID=3242192 RepID=UPI0028050696|nr:DEAD/DEAH box helicase family protein [Microbacterium protaetiae]